MLLDAEGRLWVGTEGQGLFRSDRALRDLSHVDLPLPSPSVYALAVSPVIRSSRLFIGTSEGLVSLPLSSLENP
jgi:ligand-binding sensor domain-containing protein